MRSFAIFTAIFAFSIFVANGKSLRYQAPDECKWFAVFAGEETDRELSASATAPDDQEVALVCRVKTINSEFEKTNFSVIQAQYTVKLKIVCDRSIFFRSGIDAGSFQTLIDLKDLSIENCKIGNVTNGAFKGLRQLRNLTLRTRNNEWEGGIPMELAPNAFADDLHLLETLDFSWNNLKYLPQGVFCPLHNLVSLNLTGNKLSNLDQLQFNGVASADTADNNEIGKCGERLEILDLSVNLFDVLPQKIFHRLNRLEELYLQDNRIGFIAEHAFDNLSSLQILDAARNKLVNLSPELFAHTRELKEIHLQNNSINVLAPGIFSDLTKLVLLDLSDNDLTEEWVNSATFTGLISLVVLNLSGNNVSKLDAFMFRDLYSLQVLRLESNSLHYIPENAFSSLSELNTLVLSNNKIKRVERFTFDGLSGLTLLAVDNNRLQTISEDAFFNCTRLEDLHLNGNELTDVPAALKNVPNLKTLDLATNKISNVYVNSFPAMPQLIGLRLTENNISRIAKGVFDKLQELQIINLSNNKIQKIEPGTFDSNIKVVAIRIDGNYLTEVEGLFSKLPNLVWLNISENFLEWFDYALIPTGLQWLDIHGNKIKELGNHFEIENQLHLSVFDASYNRLTEITGSSVPDNVQNLYLSNNQISKIQSYAFFKKPNLTRVDLVGNQLKTLTPHSLRISTVPPGKVIPEFYVANNPFQCDCTMQWLQTYSVEVERNKPVLADLNDVTCELLYNRDDRSVPIKEATADQFLCPYQLECAKRGMCDCCDFDACDCKMICPGNCTCYHSVSASANVVSCSKAGYSVHIPEKIPMNVTQLYLDGNDIPILSSHSFIGRRMLKILFMNASNIEIVHNRTFFGLKELEVLRLERNKIAALRGNEFEGLEKLRELYLEKNAITSIHPNTFVSLFALNVLRLDGNRLTHFTSWKLPPTLTFITMAENPWSCECQFLQKFQEYIGYLGESVADSYEMKCYNASTPKFVIMSENLTNVCGEDEADFINQAAGNISTNFIEGALNGNVTRKTTEEFNYVPITVIAVTLLLLTGLVLLLICTYREEMRVWFYTKFGVRLFYPTGEIEMDDRDKLFDAFVSYSLKDDAFVAEELAPILENGDPSYRLCLTYRDFPTGSYISDTIVQAVESSRRTIVVISENFLKSEWCNYELRSAHHQVLRDRRKRLIVIVLADVPQKDLDPDIRLYLKNNAYLQWGDKLFWEKLKFLLPDVPNNQRHKNNRARPHVNSHPHHHASLHRHHHIRNSPVRPTAAVAHI